MNPPLQQATIRHYGMQLQPITVGGLGHVGTGTLYADPGGPWEDPYFGILSGSCWVNAWMGRFATR
jgi:hypothetical protein